ncbi:hypothetical protein B0F90DRAFT_213339 [Multifurca ochricompacta]|uniref:Uncharacterized protein n=1 Tax=Multifurca ochricompacta TaxID=376703 RepID=A0AAD4M5B5_9AGAM|nr:hypothetical protein B0F90DRAFT_213339 [Multifurca ochricompacta]
MYNTVCRRCPSLSSCRCRRRPEPYFKVRVSVFFFFLVGPGLQFSPPPTAQPAYPTHPPFLARARGLNDRWCLGGVGSAVNKT